MCLSSLLVYNACLSILCSRVYFFPLSFMINSCQHAFWRSVASFLYLTGRWHFKYRILCLPFGCSVLLVLGRVQRRDQVTQCIPQTDIHLIIHLPCQRMDKEGTVKKTMAFLFCCQKPVPSSLLFFHYVAVYPLVEEILEGFLLLACYSDFEDLRFEMECLSTSQDLLFDIIILLTFF